MNVGMMPPLNHMVKAMWNISSLQPRKARRDRG